MGQNARDGVCEMGCGVWKWVLGECSTWNMVRKAVEEKTVYSGVVGQRGLYVSGRLSPVRALDGGMFGWIFCDERRERFCHG